jgi:hypothetical protein
METLMTEYDLSKIHIYVDKGDYCEETSLKELLETKEGDTIFRWFLREISRNGINLELGKVTENTVQRMLHILEKMEVPATLIVEESA